MITDRQRQILEAVIDCYINSAEPVSSSCVCKKYMPNVSSATIRNEMSELEFNNYLYQPHVSAGRVPTHLAYRLYVDSLIKQRAYELEDYFQTKQQLMNRMQQMEDIIYSAAQALSDMTKYTSVLMMPKRGELKVSALQLVRISKGTALLVIITDGGIIRDSVVHVSETLDNNSLFSISNMLTESLKGRSLREVQGLLKIYASHSGADVRVMCGIAELAEQIEKQAASDLLLVCGSQNILHHPEYVDVAKAKEFLQVLEEKERLMKIMRAYSNSGLCALIGPEIGIPEMHSCSFIMANFDVGDGHHGVVGLIGPTRMPYSKALSTLRETGNTLSSMLGAYNTY